MRGVIIIAAAVALAACGAQSHVKPNPPAPEVLEVQVRTFVPIARELTERCKWPRKGRPSEALRIGNERKKCLIEYEARLDRIEQVQGKPVPAAGQ